MRWRCPSVGKKLIYRSSQHDAVDVESFQELCISALLGRL